MGNLILDEASGVYRDSETQRPFIRVTHAIEARGLMDDEDREWITPEGLLRGTYLHKACALDAVGLLKEESIDDVLRPKVEGFRKWKREKNPRFIEREHRVRSDAYGIAGTLDALVEMDGEEIIIDYKGGPPKIWHRLQTALYALCLGRPVRRAALYLKEYDYRWDPHKERIDFEWAKAVISLTLMKAMENHR